MSKSLYNIIKEKNEETNQTESTSDDKKRKTQLIQQKECNIAWCKT